ncbi:DUF4410 domain-containing protein [Cupriavidus basilensis]|uniref:DUF4410 domain-containing protein n=1 Tax=Cupriavidus basilensis TaxID=68895 RepID=A0A0C4YED4_9BURK|nr:DUF4410 domain-containing protein [Cupriavidus basilensis]AJG19141.1 hypothetical protein RR42_m1744 [Cupriavidus basilensis]
MRIFSASALALTGLFALEGCASYLAAKESVSDLHPVAGMSGRMPLQVQACVDRTGYAGRDLGREATEALTAKLKEAAGFELEPDGRYVLTCDISAFEEGSAFKRWLLPSWGTTSGQVAVMITDSATGETIALVRGRATVQAGGLYSVGADKIILASAIDDVVRQLRLLAPDFVPGK